MGMIFTPLATMAQTPNDTLDFNTVNYQLLQKLTFENINNYRQAAGVGELKHDDILFKAAEDQAVFVSGKGKIGHKQPDLQKATVKERVKHYGGVMRGTGENAAGFTILRLTRLSTSATTDTITTIYTYQQAADVMVNMWYFSTAHKKNMLYPKFNLSGISIRVDAKTSSLYCIHVMGYK